MILSRSDFEPLIGKDILIEPILSKTISEYYIQFTLDNKFSSPKGGRIVVGEDVSDLYDEFHTDEFILKPNEFVLARTHEKIAISNEYALFIEGKSSLARLGLEVVMTASFISPGHGYTSNGPSPRPIVLELYNSGPFDLILKPGIVISKAIIHKVKTPLDFYDDFGLYGRESVEDTLYPRW